jgi:hypothetical protein
MGLLLDYSSDDDDEESPGESTRSSNISKVQYTGPTLPGLIAFIVVSCGLHEFLTL